MDVIRYTRKINTEDTPWVEGWVPSPLEVQLIGIQPRQYKPTVIVFIN